MAYCLSLKSNVKWSVVVGVDKPGNKLSYGRIVISQWTKTMNGHFYFLLWAGSQPVMDVIAYNFDWYILGSG